MTGRLNQGYVYSEQLDARASGRELAAYLAEHHQHSDLPTWRARIEAGEVSLDGKVAALEVRLVAGQRLEWRRPPWIEPDVPRHVEVIHEDAELLVVSKPSGLPSAPAGGFLENTLLALVRERDSGWAPLHRLGRGTSGLVVFARSAQTRAALSAAFRDRQVQKLYRALASGAVPPEPFLVEVPIGPVAHPQLPGLHAASPTGRSARSRVSLVATRGDASLVDVAIETGRPHQIRIHLAAAGHPLVGDPLYAVGGGVRPDALPGDLGYLLHAWRISFVHPATRQQVAFEAPLPAGLLP